MADLLTVLLTFPCALLNRAPAPVEQRNVAEPTGRVPEMSILTDQRHPAACAIGVPVSRAAAAGPVALARRAGGCGAGRRQEYRRRDRPSEANDSIQEPAQDTGPDGRYCGHRRAVAFGPAGGAVAGATGRPVAPVTAQRSSITFQAANLGDHDEFVVTFPAAAAPALS